MPNITETRDAFFARHGIKPCHLCVARENPGTGIGPVLAQILLGSYATREAERLERLLKRSTAITAIGAPRTREIQSDAWDERMRQENEALYIRACWLGDMIPDQDKIARPAYASSNTNDDDDDTDHADINKGEAA